MSPLFVRQARETFWLSRKRTELRAKQTGGQLDAVEKDIDYVKAGHEAGIFYAEYYGWNIIQCLENKKELTSDEVHHKVIKALRF